MAWKKIYALEDIGMLIEHSYKKDEFITFFYKNDRECSYSEPAHKLYEKCGGLKNPSMSFEDLCRAMVDYVLKNGLLVHPMEELI